MGVWVWERSDHRIASAYIFSMRSTTALTVNSRARSRPAMPNLFAVSGSFNTVVSAFANAAASPGAPEARLAVDDHVQNPARGRGNYRPAGCHGLEDHCGTWVGPHRGDDDRPRRPEQRHHLFVRQGTRPFGARGNRHSSGEADRPANTSRGGDSRSAYASRRVCTPLSGLRSPTKSRVHRVPSGISSRTISSGMKLGSPAS